VCLVGWDAGNSRPKVARASRAKLATSKTVFGVAIANATDTNPVVVRVGGEVVDTSIATGLPAGSGAGTSRIVATDIKAENPDPVARSDGAVPHDPRREAKWLRTHLRHGR
jgi:hypothetical protein